MQLDDLVKDPVVIPAFTDRRSTQDTKKWGFTKLSREDYINARAVGHLQPDGCNVKYPPEKVQPCLL